MTDVKILAQNIREPVVEDGRDYKACLGCKVVHWIPGEKVRCLPCAVRFNLRKDEISIDDF